MKYKSRLSALLFIVLLFTAGTQLVFSQAFQFHNFSLEDGLPARYVYSIQQDQQGYIWLATSSGLARFDGMEFHPETGAGELVSDFPSTLHIDSDNRLWIGYNDGSLVFYNGERYTRFEHKNFRKGGVIQNILEDEEGFLLVVSQNGGIYRINPEDPEYLLRLDIENMTLFSAALCRDNRLMLGTQSGLQVYAYSSGELTLLSKVENIDSQVASIYSDCLIDQVFAGTIDNGLYRISMERERTVFSAQSLTDILPVDRPLISQIYRDIEGNMWITTKQNGLIKLVYSEEKNAFTGAVNYREENGLPGNDLQSVFQDLEGNMWFGMYGTGLSVLTSNAFTFYVPGEKASETNIIDIELKGNEYLMATALGYHRINRFSGEKTGFTEVSSHISNLLVTSLHVDQEGVVWIGTEYGGLYRQEGNRFRRMFYSGSRTENLIRDITSNGRHLWLGTDNGVLILNRKSGAVIKHYTTSTLLPHNSINQIYLDSQGRGWISTVSNRLYVADPGDGISQGKAVYQSMNEFMGVTVDVDGNMWCATRKNGVCCITQDTTYRLFSMHGLKSDYCYSIMADRAGNVWVGHRQGFSRISTTTHSIRTFDRTGGFSGDCNQNAMYLSPDGKVLIGTNEGAVQYNPDEDRGSLFPPINNIVSVSIDNEEVPLQEHYELPYKPNYTIEIKYIGLYFSNPASVLYQYQMENFDPDWSRITKNRMVSYRLGYGHYQFKVLSYNQEGFSSEKPIGFTIEIRKPFWLRWWFFAGLLFLLAFGFYVVIRIRERAQRRQQQTLERELAERTREVVEQKEEIETQNKEITDSINYAQRIQASLLPSVQKLREYFHGAFVYYRPRDIVSGDFFWFDQVGEDKFLLVCADSTGHGVPGAFMSMIGSALIQEIVTRKEITKPSEILRTLDREISSTLNQNVDSAKSNDGMDMVVCEFNLKTRLLRFASAMRPVILIMDEEQFYIRGNRCSVGGEVAKEKFFDDQEYFLKPGDIVYLFSDGFPDQFGGEAGKKMKMVRLKELLDEVVELPMDEQYKRIKKYFEDWMGDLPQVDDVLFMGIQI